MFSNLDFNSVYTIFGLTNLPFLLIILAFCWSNINFRYILLVIISVEFFESLTVDMAFQWGNEYYLWFAMSGALSITLILGRRLIALNMQKASIFFKKASFEYKFLRQEGALLFCYAITVLIYLVTYIEATLYTNSILGSYTFQKIFFGPSITLIHIVCYALVIRMAFRVKWMNDAKQKGITA
ncbi:hypothetical protein JL49_24295 [Pseudoalteromonas luteoviolacea]|nr:hypothetical protein JL49_24295 [Pseudoalteromonas luteoviolacea]